MSQESVVSLRTRPWDKGLCVWGGVRHAGASPRSSKQGMGELA